MIDSILTAEYPFRDIMYRFTLIKSKEIQGENFVGFRCDRVIKRVNVLTNQYIGILGLITSMVSHATDRTVSRRSLTAQVRLSPRPVHVGFTVDQVAQEQV
jgi:hypothetical protein